MPCNDVLLLHGALGSKSQFDQLVDHLEPRYRVHCINFSGHGGRCTEAVFSLDLFCRDVIAYLNENNLKKVFMFGYSMGGYVALSFALRYPVLTDKIFTLGTRFEWSQQIAQKEILRLNPDTMQVKVPAYTELLRERHAPCNWKDVVDKTAAFMIMLGNDPITENEFNKIDCSVRIAVGDFDTMVDARHSRITASCLPNGSFTIFQNTPHPFEQVNVERLSTELKSFFSGS